MFGLLASNRQYVPDIYAGAQILQLAARRQMRTRVHPLFPHERVCVNFWVSADLSALHILRLFDIIASRKSRKMRRTLVFFPFDSRTVFFIIARGGRAGEKVFILITIFAL
jgi:hypothetical protein